MRYDAKIDKNQNAIVEALRDIPGVTVALKHDDILVGNAGRTFWYEIKSDSAVSRKTGKVLESRKKKSQVKLEAKWTGHYRIVSSLDEILSDMRFQQQQLEVNRRSHKWIKKHGDIET